MAKEAIELHLEGLAAHGQSIPASDEQQTVEISAEITVMLKRA